MKVLLNITPNELKETSGDMSYLRDLIALSISNLNGCVLTTFSILQSASIAI